MWDGPDKALNQQMSQIITDMICAGQRRLQINNLPNGSRHQVPIQTVSCNVCNH